MAHKKKATKKSTKRKRTTSPAIAQPFERKKAKPVKSEKGKLKVLAELKGIQSQIDKMNAADRKRFHSQDKLFTKARTLRDKLGIN